MRSMRTVESNRTFVETFKSIVNSPEETVFSKFTTITPTHIPGTERNYWWATVGMVSAISAVVTWSYDYKKNCLGFAAVAVTGFISFYNSSKTIQVPTEAFSKQCQAVKDLFNPCIKGLKAAHQAKSKTICDVFKGKVYKKDPHITLTTKIDLYSQLYDEGKGDPLQVEEGTSSTFDVGQQAHFQELLPFAKTLSEKELSSLPEDLSEHAKEMYSKLQQASINLLHGYPKRKDELPKDARPYVHALVDNNGAAQVRSWSSSPVARSLVSSRSNLNKNRQNNSVSH